MHVRFAPPRSLAVILAAASLSCGTPETSTTNTAAPSAAPSAAPIAAQPAEIIARAGPVAEDLYASLYPPAVSLAVDSDGRGWAVWARHQPPRVEGARLDGGWQAPAIVRDCEEAIDGLPGRYCTDAAIVLNDGGRVIAGWTENHGDWVCMASEWRAGTWTAAVRVQDEPTGSYSTRGRGLGLPGGPSLSIDAGGHAWMFWWRRPDSSYPYAPPQTLMASYSPAAGEWSVEEALDQDAVLGGAGPAAATLANGERVVAWSVYAGIESALVSPSRRWRRREVAHADAGTYFGSVASLPAGDVVVAWAVRPQQPSDLSVARLTPNLQVAETIAVAEDGLEAPQVAVSPAGAMFVVWPTDGGVAARSTPRWGDPLSPTQVIRSLGPASNVQVAASPGGAVATWVDGDSAAGPRVASAQLRPQGWSEVTTLHQGRPREKLSPPRLAVDKRGDAVVAFSSTSFPEKEVAIHAARYRAQ